MQYCSIVYFSLKFIIKIQSTTGFESGLYWNFPLKWSKTKNDKKTENRGLGTKLHLNCNTDFFIFFWSQTLILFSMNVTKKLTQELTVRGFRAGGAIFDFFIEKKRFFEV